MIYRLFVALALLAACGRPLTEGETAFANSILGPELDTSAVRLVDGAPTRAVTFRRRARPRVTCREKILPPPDGEIVTAKPAAVSLYNRVLFDRDWYLDDYMPEFPDRISLVAGMLFAHEMTHVWQWQNRAKTGYSPLRAASEHRGNSDPYLFDIAQDHQFASFGYEQQGAIIEEYVCCRALAPQAARTQRLHALITQSIPASPLPQSRAYAVRMPWDGVELTGICD